MNFANSTVIWDWQVQNSSEDSLNINPLRYTNRAQCAIDSNSPTKSAFVILDTISPGKSFYRLAKQLGVNEAELVGSGVNTVRKSILSLISLTAKRILNGELPIIKANLNDLKNQELVDAFDDCENNLKCSKKNKMLRLIWESSKSELISNTKFGHSDFLSLSSGPKLSCYYVKQFSAIQGHLMSSSPTAKGANTLGETMNKNSEYMVSCDKLPLDIDLKVANYQVEFVNIDNKTWDKVGFDVWNSLKIYLSWAFRNSKEIQKISSPYSSIVKSINLEEIMLFFSNGCKSIDNPSCDSKTLNLNSLRAFSQMSDEKEVFKTDMMNQVVEGVEASVVSQSIINVNDDLLNMGKTGDAVSWAQNFRDNFTKTRGFHKLKFINAINKLNLIKGNLSIEALEYEIQKTSNLPVTNITRSELYYMCSEFKIAADEKFSFLNADLSLLAEDNPLDQLSHRIGGDKIKNYFSYYKTLAKSVLNICDGLQSNKYWGASFEVNRDGFTSWYKEHTTDVVFSNKMNINSSTLSELSPILTFAPKGMSSKRSEVVCVDGSNCARHLLDSIVDLYSNLKYADSLLPGTEIASPNMVNPYSEKLACKIYDPWKKKKDVISNFFGDLSRAALFGLLPSPVYISSDVKDKKVVKLKTLLENGQIKFDQIYDEKKVRNSFIADMGPLLGVPCAVSISNDRFNPLRYYRFNGISVGTCHERSENNTTVNSSTDMSSTSEEGSRCFSCSINLETVAGVAASIEPITRSAYFLIRGVWNLVKGMRDPYDIPRSWSLDVNQVHNTYKKYGLVNNFCLKKLLNGTSCMGNSCESAIVDSASKYLKGSIDGTYATRLRGDGYLKLTTCDEPVRVLLSGNRGRICSGNNNMTRDDLVIPSQCDIDKVLYEK